MAGKVNPPGSRPVPATPSGDTATYDQLQASRRRGVTTRKLEKTPHERDESASDTGNRLDESLSATGDEIAQAHDDIEEGRKDTERRGVPGDVPGSRQNRER